MLGMNVDPCNPANCPSPWVDLLLAGVGWVRMVSRPDPEVAAYRDAVRVRGLAVLCVITEQSGGFVLPDCDVYQCGNEPDVPGTADSMSAVDYTNYWRLYSDQFFAPGRDLFGVPLIAAGLGSGQPSYWQAVQTHGGLPDAAGFAVHPYAKTPSQVATLLKAYQKITPGLPLWVSECNRPIEQIPALAKVLRENAVMAAWFAFGGQRDPQFNCSPATLRTLRACW